MGIRRPLKPHLHRVQCCLLFPSYYNMRTYNTDNLIPTNNSNNCNDFKESKKTDEYKVGSPHNNMHIAYIG